MKYLLINFKLSLANKAVVDFVKQIYSKFSFSQNITNIKIIMKILDKLKLKSLNIVDIFIIASAKEVPEIVK